MKKYSIYHQKAGSHFWDCKATFESKEDAQKKIIDWALLDGVEINEDNEGYSFDQNYYRILASDESCHNNKDCQEIWLIS